MRILAGLFPYSQGVFPFVKRFTDLQDTYTIVEIISPAGWGLSGKDAAYACNCPKLGINVVEEFGNIWDTLIIPRPLASEIVSVDEMVTAAEFSLKIDKRVLYIDDSPYNVPDKISALQKKHPGKMAIYPDVIDNGFHRMKLSMRDYESSRVPVILVGGLVNSADVQDVLASLAIRFRQDGFKPSVFSMHSISGLFGFHCISHLFFNENTESEKIAAINQFVRLVEQKEVPDVILIEAPDAVMRFSDSTPNGFGIRSYMVCQAVKPDYFVCCVPFELAQPKFLEEISSDFSLRLGCSISAVNVSNIIVDSADAFHSKKLSYVHADVEYIQKHIADVGKQTTPPLFDTFNDGIDSMYAHLCAIAH